MEDGFRLTVCNPATHANEDCSLSAVCTVKGPMAEVHRRLIEVLRGVSLAELFDQFSPRPTPLAALPVLAAAGCDLSSVSG